MSSHYELPAVWQNNWQQAGFSEPSLIQKKVYQLLKNGETIVGVSPTGSGKTLAYLLPLMEKIEAGSGQQLLILASSQELTVQVAEVARQWGQAVDLKTQSIIGGANINRQIEKLKNKPEILIGTPGRVLELIKAKKIKAHQLRCVVLDEVDQLLQKGAFELTQAILKYLSKNTQLAFFSATADAALSEIEKLTTQPYSVINVTKEDTSKGIIHHYYLNYPKRKLVDALRRLAHLENFRGLVFFNQLAELGAAEEKLLFHNVPVASLASDQSKLLRRGALDLFKTGSISELLTTDVASRGLDIQQLEFVVNTEVPSTKESYLHRAGRVGRMGQPGTVITIVQEHTLKDLKKITTDPQIVLQEVFLHGGQLHLEKPNIEKAETAADMPRKPKKKKTAVAAEVFSSPDEKKIVKQKRAKNKSKKQKNKGARRH